MNWTLKIKASWKILMNFGLIDGARSSVGSAIDERVVSHLKVSVIYSSSVASFLVLGGGGGGARPRNVPTKNMYLYCASERLRNIYFHDSKYICIVIYNAVSFNYLWYGAINDIILTKHYIKKNL